MKVALEAIERASFNLRTLPHKDVEVEDLRVDPVFCFSNLWITKSQFKRVSEIAAKEGCSFDDALRLMLDAAIADGSY